MKKIILFILCIQLTNIPALAGELVNDDFVDKTLKEKNLQIIKQNQQTVEDTFVEKSLNGKTYKKEAVVESERDLLVEKKLSPEKHPMVKINQTTTTDEFAEKTLKNCKQIKVQKYSDFDCDLTKRVPVKIKITKNITTRKDLEEGQYLDFIVADDVKVNNKTIIPKSSTIKALVETISPNQAVGVPADLDIGQFTVVKPNRAEIPLDGTIHKVGANRALWLYPAACGAMIFFFAGLLLLPIRGGHAKIKTNQTYEVYYIPSL